MKWKGGQRSDNVVDVRGSGRRSGFGGGGGKLGLGGIAAVVVISLLLGKNPLEMLGLVSQMTGGMQQAVPQEGAPPPQNDETADFVRAILGETEVVWGEVFQQSGRQYEQPKLVLFSGGVDSACGSASSASGPFYCPGDHQVYLDMSFFNDMQQRLGGGGDFAYAYVIAHEVGHHVQTLMGVSDKVNQARRAGKNVQGDGGLLVRQELQADCLAGVWANRSEKKLQWLETGDVEEALNTATAIGDDRLQKQSQGTVVPDAFSHGTSEQRVRWFRAGFESGDPNVCDTFKAARL
ncbi:neutral zinc metallopeptidase [Solimonas sp. K1W22B-7]|uniref:KPN_02809 family neutral zinc metallopeptidase n=1 Tax=Solimonas sp. K1W22B-7 TaxID=2303331 RepID=UPI000E32E0FB|nr:neutral zinc metallopeptidase [Solimonas sp. K1W22B-7]AXQ29927.1 neutral zinc metallopeptidase [Solimonas sp. K1W22B-7]